MSKFRGFIVKEFYHIFRDRRTLLILFGVPVIQLILFGFAIRNEIKDIRIGVVDRSNDHITQQITDKLEASDYFTIVERFDAARQVEQAFQNGSIREAIVLEASFAEKLRSMEGVQVQVITDATDPNTSETMLTYTSSILNDVQRQLNAGHTSNLVQIVPETRMRFNPGLESVNLFVPGLIAVILMLISALMTSITITREKEMGTMEVLLASPLRPIQIIVGKVLPYLFLSFVNVITVLVLAWLVFGVPIRGSIPLLLLESLLFIFCALALGILISTISRTQQTATMVSLAGLLLPTVILSGFIFPISSMPTILQWISNLIPARWFLIIIRGIMLKGIGLEYLWKETLILGGMTLVLIAVSIRNFDVRLR